MKYTTESPVTNRAVFIGKQPINKMVGNVRVFEAFAFRLEDRHPRIVYFIEHDSMIYHSHEGSKFVNLIIATPCIKEYLERLTWTVVGWPLKRIELHALVLNRRTGSRHIAQGKMRGDSETRN